MSIRRMKRKMREISGALALLVLLGGGFLYWQKTNPTAAPMPDNPDFSVSVLDIGIGDSILVRCEGKAMLIDAGENDAGDRVLGYLSQAGVEKLDVAVGTHAHSDHIGGMDTVLSKIPCDQLIMSEMAPSAVPTTKTYTDLLGVVETKQIPLVKAQAGESFALGGASVTILGPVKVYEELNDTSVVLRIDYGQTSFLFTGDMEKSAEKNLLAAGAQLKADFLKVGHHGSTTSTSKAFLDQVQPSFAAISVNVDNPYGHPHQEVLDRLKRSGTEVLLTRDAGTITYTSDGKAVTRYEEKKVA